MNLSPNSINISLQRVKLIIGLHILKGHQMLLAAKLQKREPLIIQTCQQRQKAPEAVKKTGRMLIRIALEREQRQLWKKCNLNQRVQAVLPAWQKNGGDNRRIIANFIINLKEHL